MTKICQLLASLAPPARQRVIGYVSARADSLPVLAAVGGGTEDEPLPALPFGQPRGDATAAAKN